MTVVSLRPRPATACWQSCWGRRCREGAGAGDKDMRQQGNIFASASCHNPKCEIESSSVKNESNCRSLKGVGGGGGFSSVWDGQGPWKPAGRPHSQRRHRTPQSSKMAPQRRLQVCGVLHVVWPGVIAWRAFPAPPAKTRRVAESPSRSDTNKGSAVALCAAAASR